jgi:hypothetical protein
VTAVTFGVTRFCRSWAGTHVTGENT